MPSNIVSCKQSNALMLNSLDLISRSGIFKIICKASMWLPTTATYSVCSCLSTFISVNFIHSTFIHGTSGDFCVYLDFQMWMIVIICSISCT